MQTPNDELSPSADEEPEVAPSSEPDPNEVSSPSALQDALAQVLRRIVNRGQREIERVASTGRQALELRQLQKDLDHFWVRLGKTAYHLNKAGELDHPAIAKAITRIEELEAQIDEMRSRG